MATIDEFLQSFKDKEAEEEEEERQQQQAEPQDRRGRLESALMALRPDTDLTQGVGEPVEALGDPLADPEGSFSLVGLVSSLNNPTGFITGIARGAVSTTVFDTMKSLGQVFNLDSWVEFSERAEQQNYTQYEQVAKRVGMSDDEIASVYATGNFLGIFAPLGSSIGAARVGLRGAKAVASSSKLLGASRVAQGLERAGVAATRNDAVGAAARMVTTGNFMAETAGGIVYGGILDPLEEEETRLSNMMHEAAMVGVGRLVINGLLFPMRGFQMRYTGQKVDDLFGSPLTKTIRLETQQRIAAEKALAAGRSTYQEILERSAPMTDGALNRMNVETLIVGSMRGQNRLVEDIDPMVVIIEAMQDTYSRNGHTSGLVNIRADGSAPSDVIAELFGEEQFVGRLGLEFPMFDFRRVKNGRTGAEQVLFAVKPIDPKLLGDDIGEEFITDLLQQKTAGITDDMVKQIEADGFFEGQVIRGPSNEKAIFSRMAGSFTDDSGEVVEQAWIRGSDGLPENLAQVRHLTPSFQADDLNLKPTKAFDKLRGSFELFNEKFVQTMSRGAGRSSRQLRRLDVINDGIEISEQARRSSMPEGMLPEDNAFDNTLPPILRERTQQLGAEIQTGQRGLAEARAVADQAKKKLEKNPLDQEAQASLQQATQVTADLTEDVNTAFQELSLLELSSPVGIQGEIIRNGYEAADLLDDFEGIPLGTRIDLWARVNGISQTAPDYLAMKALMIREMRDDAFKEVYKENPLLREIMTRLNKESWESYTTQGVDVARMARSRGLQYGLDPEGSGVAIVRNVKDGRVIGFKNEAEAADRLQRLLVDGEDLTGSDLVARFNVSNGVVSPFRPPSDVVVFETLDGNIDNIVSVLGDPKNFGFEAKSPWFAPIRKWMLEVEKQTNLPVFTRGFDLMQQRLQVVNQGYELLAPRVSDVWKGMNRGQREGVGAFYREIGGLFRHGPLDLDNLPESIAHIDKDLLRRVSKFDRVAELRLAKEMGLNARQVNAVRDARVMMEEYSLRLNLDSDQFLPLYFSHIRPQALRGKMIDLNVRPGSKSWDFWAKRTNDGSMPSVELDPMVVMDKYTRTMLLEEQVMPVWNQMNKLRTMTARQLSPNMRAKVQQEAKRKLADDEFVLSRSVRDGLDSYLTAIRGMTSDGPGTVTKSIQGLGKLLGMRVDAGIVEEFARIGTSLIYGATMGARAIIMTRNATQNMWFGWTRLGGDHYELAMRRTLTLDGIREAIEAGAVRRDKLVDMGSDPAFIKQLESIGIADAGEVLQRGNIENAFTDLIQKASRGTIQAGRLATSGANIAGRDIPGLSEVLLRGFNSVDDINRVQAFHWQRMFTSDSFDRLKTNLAANGDDVPGMMRRAKELLALEDLPENLSKGERMTLEFLEDGLPYYSPIIKGEFVDRAMTSEISALDFIGAQAADEWNFIYGRGANPSWMQTPAGRFVGTFATYPMNHLEYMRSTWVNGTKKQRALFAVRAGAMLGAYANMGAQTGIDFSSYLNFTPQGLVYTGGPGADLTVDALEVADATVRLDFERSGQGLNRMAGNLGRIWMPGTTAFTDITRMRNPVNGAESAYWFMLGRPYWGDNRYSMAMDVTFSPNITGSNISPDRVPSAEGMHFGQALTQGVGTPVGGGSAGFVPPSIGEAAAFSRDLFFSYGGLIPAAKGLKPENLQRAVSPEEIFERQQARANREASQLSGGVPLGQDLTGVAGAAVAGVEQRVTEQFDRVTGGRRPGNTP